MKVTFSILNLFLNTTKELAFIHSFRIGAAELRRRNFSFKASTTKIFVSLKTKTTQFYENFLRTFSSKEKITIRKSSRNKRYVKKFAVRWFTDWIHPNFGCQGIPLVGCWSLHSKLVHRNCRYPEKIMRISRKASWWKSWTHEIFSTDNVEYSWSSKRKTIFVL